MGENDYSRLKPDPFLTIYTEVYVTERLKCSKINNKSMRRKHNWYDIILWKGISLLGWYGTKISYRKRQVIIIIKKIETSNV